MLEVLLIDDEATIRLWLGDALRDAGHRVTIAADGAEGLALSTSKVFDVVITDIRLPRVDGLTIFRRVHAESPSTVILITAHGHVGEAVAALKEAIERACVLANGKEIELCHLPEDIAGRSPEAARKNLWEKLRAHGVTKEQLR